MTLAALAVVFGLILLVWSADRFLLGASGTAQHLGMPPLLIGMVIVGFGTSAPEMVVSALAAGQGNPGLALGNAFGSNVANIGLILGTTALISPIAVQSRILRKELPLLTAVTLLTVWLLFDNRLTGVEAAAMLILFGGLLAWSIRQGMRQPQDVLAEATAQELPEQPSPLGRAIFWLLLGLAMLLASSRMLVWGAVEIACRFGVSDLVIGLTIVALGTSLPELASSIVAALRGEHDIALGNVIGSNLFNTLAVVGIAGAIHPIVVGPEVFSRDIPVMALLTVSLFVFGYGFKGPGRINRLKGGMLMLGYFGYMGYLAGAVVGP
jgi:cation:H+ antiporter